MINPTVLTIIIFIIFIVMIINAVICLFRLRGVRGSRTDGDALSERPGALPLQILVHDSAAVLVQPGLQVREVRVHPADVVLDGLVGLLYAPHLRARLLG